MQYLVVTHKGCMDGIAAAMVARRWARAQLAAQSPEFVDDDDFAAAIDRCIEVMPCDYGMPVDVEHARGRYVIVTDFAVKDAANSFAPMLALARVASEFAWFDHHITAQPLVEPLRLMTIEEARTRVVFDTNRSGAGIAWDALFPNEPRPWLVSYVEDRDLWRFALPESRAVNCYVQSLPKTVDAYEQALAEPLEDAVRSGRAMQAYLGGWVQATADNARLVDFEGFANVPIVTCTYSGIADVLERMLVQYGAPIALAWLQRKDGMFQYSLRSAGVVDVSEIAKRFGGGGHHNAAGFQSKTFFPWCDNVLSEASN